MMFLQYVVPGAVLPVLSHYLKNRLGFEPYQAGLVMAMPAAAALFAPLAASRIADRYISAERFVALCHFVCAGLMLCIYSLETFPAILVVYFLYGLCFTPTFGLTNTVALHQTPDARRDFGGVRMWGTIGWVVVAWILGYGWLRGGTAAGERLPHTLIVSACVSLAFAFYMLTFPAGHFDRNNKQGIRYREVLRVLVRPSLLLLFAMTFFNSICNQFYAFGMGMYLSQMGFADKHIMPVMSLGQMTEVIMLGLLGWLLLRIGMKRTLVLGVAAQCLRFVLFAFEGPTPIIIAGISVHGITFACYFITAYLYLDYHSTPDTRAGAQQLLTIMISGCGGLMGYVAAGLTAQYFTFGPDKLIDYQGFWLVPAGLSAAIGFVLLLGFREEPCKTPTNGAGGGAA